MNNFPSSSAYTPHTYRPEIDGLRAIAVTAVIWFHAGLPGAKSGFVGVDIFFVISGFLITSLILQDLNKGQFSIGHFYERRARRILPALYVVTASTLLIGAMFLPAREMRQLSNSVIFVTTFLSNFHFLFKINYFDPVAHLKPLLHTWSLAVEEQFYIIFPAVLWLLRKQSWVQMLWLLTGLGLASLLLIFLIQPSHEPATFYLLPTRAWELIAGAMCAVCIDKVKPNTAPAVIGLGLILCSISVLNEDAAWPSAWTIMPVLGTALVILYAREGTVVKSVLSNRPLVGIGLMSYSAYLWHHPLMATVRSLSDGRPLPITAMVLVIIATFLLAFLTWKFIEQPWRKKGGPAIFHGRKAFAVAGTTTVLLLAIGYAGRVADGWPGRLDPALQDTFVRLRHNEGLGDKCSEGFKPGTTCSTGPISQTLLWGDSLAMHLVEGLTSGAASPNLFQSTKSACAPTIGVAPHEPNFGSDWSSDCIKHNAETFEFIQASSEIKTVALSSGFGGFFGDNVLVGNDAKPLHKSISAETAILQTMKALVDAGRKVVFIAPPPPAGFDVGQCLIFARRFNKEAGYCDFDLAPARERHIQLRSMLERVSNEYKIIWLDEALCPEMKCRAEVDGIFIYRDATHLSYEGSRWVGQKLDLFNRINTPDDTVPR